MSSDLFAAFGRESTPDPSRIEPTGPPPKDPFEQTNRWHEAPEDSKQHSQDDLRQSAANNGLLSQPIEDEDDFGDFEDAAASATIPAEETRHVRDLNQSTRQSVPTQESTKLPFKPKPEPKPSPLGTKPVDDQTGIGQHPFAGKWDLLFEAGDDEYDAGADELGDLSTNPEAAMAYSKRIIAEQEAAQQRRPTPAQKQPAQALKAVPVMAVKAEPAQPAPNKLRKKSGYAPPTRNAEILFDAEDVSEHEEDDDFGDFEDWDDSAPSNRIVSNDKARQTAMPAVDLLGLGDASGTTGPMSSNAGREAQTMQRTDHDRMKATPRSTRPSAGMDLEDDAWDDFETSAPPLQTTLPNAHLSEPPSTHSTTSTPSIQPPINVPPPIILLSIFPALFASADDALFDTTSKLELKQRQALLSHPASHQFLKAYLGHCTVLAHIIAGRKLRWKRDQRLSQSMRIGPAPAGGKGGMKLAGLDKSELAKEDREIVDVLRLWKGQIGKLRTAITAASAALGLPKLPSVPDIAEQMPVKMLKQVEGGVTAPQPCALCGLKREERVARVDMEVEDSFGEWWVQGANVHVLCGRFWEEFEKKLKSR